MGTLPNGKQGLVSDLGCMMNWGLVNWGPDRPTSEPTHCFPVPLGANSGGTVSVTKGFEVEGGREAGVVVNCYW